MKKLLSVILAAVMLLGCMSVTAFAASPESDFTFDAATGTITKYEGAGGDVEIPATIGGVDVTAIGEYACFYVSSRITSVTFPSTLLSIGDGAFEGCDNMTLPTLPENLESIGSYALPGGRSNVSYDIPASVIFLGYAAFGYHTSFSSITLHWTDNIMTYNSGIFEDGDTSNATLHIPEGMTDAYAEKGWTTTAGFASIVDDVVIPSEDPEDLECEVYTLDTELTSTNHIVESEHFTYDLQNIESDVRKLQFIVNSANPLVITSKSEDITIQKVELVFNAVNNSQYLATSAGTYDKDSGIITDINSGSVTISSSVFGNCSISGVKIYYSSSSTSSFLTSFTLNKDYNDKYSTGNKTTAVSETVTYTITPISTGNDVPAFTNSTFTIDVDDGVGSAEVPLPETITKAGNYWYSIEETGGKTAGVTYDTNTYYLHLITDCKDGEFGVVSAQIHLTAPTADGYVNEASDKITTVSNSYGEGTLKITQDTTVDGADNDYDEFEVTVTFTLPEGTEITGDITYGDDQKVTFENGVGTATITLKGGEYVEFTGIPDGTTYTVEQTDSNTDLGFGDPDYTVENGETDEDVVVTESDKETKVTGTISDGEDDITIANEMNTPVDVGVILENGAFILLALGAMIAAAWLIISKRRKALDVE